MTKALPQIQEDQARGERSGRRLLVRAAVLALPALLVVAADLALRADQLLALPPKYVGSYGAAIVESALLWAVLLGCASARSGRLRWLASAAFIAMATMSIGTQLYFFGQYSTYLNIDATLFGTSMSESLYGQLGADSRNLLSAAVPPFLAALALVWLGRKLVRTRRHHARYLAMLSPLAIAGALLIPCSYRAVQSATPDVIYFHAVGGLVKLAAGWEKRAHVRPGRRTPPELPSLQARPSAPRNVILVLNESIRADLGCPSHQPSCPTMPFSNAAMPERIGLPQMRANSSTTAIQLAVLWSGLPPSSGREALHSAPLLFDYAHAAGYETAYWTSQHMMFANSRLYVQDLPTRFQCGATHLDPLADIDTGANDELLTERAKLELPRLQEPFFAVVHYGNTHVPYRTDASLAPFQPAAASKAKKDNELYRNYYKNAVLLQDRTVANLLTFIRSQALSERTIVIYTADHGEQFREHGQLGHTASLFDVELRVPTWIDAPPPTLSQRERDNLARHASEPSYHTDLSATMMDLLGLWDSPQLSDHRERMVGDSLLREERGDAPVALTNCSGVWGCAFENWGVAQGWRKLIAREWDQSWLCYDLKNDPAEQRPLPAGRCDDLEREAVALYGRLPGRE